jgi:hypothetical protein
VQAVGPEPEAAAAAAGGGGGGSSAEGTPPQQLRPRQQCLLPLLDMFNHRYAAPIIWESGGGGGSSGGGAVAATAATVGFATGKAVAVGQEIFNNYGKKTVVWSAFYTSFEINDRFTKTGSGRS